MNATISRLALQSLFGQKRWWALLSLPLLLIGLALLIQLLTRGEAGAAFEVIVVGVGITAATLVALLATTGVLGPEIDDGSIIYLLAKPISRYTVVLSKLIVAVGVTVVLGAGSLLVSGLILEPSDLQQALAVTAGMAVAGAAYCSIFMVFSAINRHAMVTGLIYVLVFEGLLASWLSGLRYLSVSAWGRRIAEGIDDSLNLAAGNLPLAYAWLASAVVVVAGCVIAGRRLSRFQLRGEE